MHKKWITFVFCLVALNLSIYSAENKIKAVIFDCDGTLVDTEEVLYLAWEHVLKKRGITLEKDKYWEIINKESIAGHPQSVPIFSEIAAVMIGQDCSQELLEEVYTFVLEQKKKGYPPILDTLNFLHDLAKAKEIEDIKIGLASGNIRRNILLHLQSLGVEMHFDAIVSGKDDLQDYNDPEGTNKPKPYVYIQAAKLLGLDPSDCVAIEDSGIGVRSAASAGCVTIAVPNSGTINDDFSQADVIVKSFSDISVEEFFRIVNYLHDTKNQVLNVKS